MIRAVLFDLDGTLIHSAPGIIGCFEEVLEAAGRAPVERVDQRVIGPPLLATLKRLTGLGDGPQLDAIAAAFRARYDSSGVLLADPYPELVDVLQSIAKSGTKAFVVTNKRIAPTRLIA